MGRADGRGCAPRSTRRRSPNGCGHPNLWLTDAESKSAVSLGNTRRHPSWPSRPNNYLFLEILVNPEPRLRRIGKRALTQNAYAPFWSLFVIVLHGTNNEQGQPRPHDFFCAGPHNKARENGWRIACSAFSAITRHTAVRRLSPFFF